MLAKKNQLMIQIQTLKDRKTSLLEITKNEELLTRNLGCLQFRRSDMVAQGLAKAEHVDTRKIDVEIAKAKQDVSDAQAHSADAQKAIQLIDDEISALQREVTKNDQAVVISKLENFDNSYSAADANVIEAQKALSAAMAKAESALEKRQSVVFGNLDGKVLKALKLIEDDLLPEFNSEIESLEPVQSGEQEGIKVIQPQKKVLKTPGQNDTFRDSIFTKIEFVLKGAAAIAEVQSEVLKQDANKKSILKLLGYIGSATVGAVRNKGLVAPEWAFSGTSYWKYWTSEDQTEPVVAFLRDHGFTQLSN